MKVTKNNKTHLVFPKEFLEEIDKLIGKRKRSQFVVKATKEKLAYENFLRVLKETAGTWTDKNHPELRTKKDIDKYIRNSRTSFKKRLKRIYGK